MRNRQTDKKNTKIDELHDSNFVMQES